MKLRGFLGLIVVFVAFQVICCGMEGSTDKIENELYGYGWRSRIKDSYPKDCDGDFDGVSDTPTKADLYNQVLEWQSKNASDYNIIYDQIDEHDIDPSWYDDTALTHGDGTEGSDAFNGFVYDSEAVVSMNADSWEEEDELEIVVEDGWYIVWDGKKLIATNKPWCK
jgi:hypothetical protein